MRREGFVDAHPHGGEQLGLFAVLDGAARAGECLPTLGVERDLAALPRSTAERDGDFEQRELVGPGREAAQAAVRVQTAEHRDERVVRRLERDVLELLAAKRRKALPATPHLVAGGAQEERM